MDDLEYENYKLLAYKLGKEHGETEDAPVSVYVFFDLIGLRCDEETANLYDSYMEGYDEMVITGR
jgi:tRNA A-37 threonylcarbamoyl transferase component Bud32